MSQKLTLNFAIGLGLVEVADSADFPASGGESGREVSHKGFDGNGQVITGTAPDPEAPVVLTFTHSDYQWTASGSGTNEYYLEADGGGDPGLTQPNDVEEDGSDMTGGTAGSLSAGEWDWADNDSLGYSTVYVRLSDNVDPDTKSAGFIKFVETIDLTSVTAPGGATQDLSSKKLIAWIIQAPTGNSAEVKVGPGDNGYDFIGESNEIVVQPGSRAAMCYDSGETTDYAAVSGGSNDEIDVYVGEGDTLNLIFVFGGT